MARGIVAVNGISEQLYNYIIANNAKISYTDAAVVAAKANTLTYTSTILTTGWLGSVAPFSKEVTIGGILSTDNPIIDIVPSATYATALLQAEAWGLVYRIVTGSNNITVYADEVPTTAIPIQLKVVR